MLVRPSKSVYVTSHGFLYDGDRLVAEYNGATLLRRYVHGPGVDEPIVWYEGSVLTDRRHLFADHQGSIINENGAVTRRYRYGPYGEPDDWRGSRFRYTGQIILDPDLNTMTPIALYHYKARVYDPVLGRFLQTDPIGYEDDLNLYAYVRNDPLNRADPTGRNSCNDNPNCPGGRAASERGPPSGNIRSPVMAFVPESSNATSPTAPNTLQATGDVLSGAATARSAQSTVTSAALNAMGHTAAAELSERALGPLSIGIDVAGEGARVAGDIQAGDDPDVAGARGIGRLGTTALATVEGAAIGTAIGGPGLGTAFGGVAGFGSEVFGLSERGGEVLGEMTERGPQPSTYDCSTTLAGC